MSILFVYVSCKTSYDDNQTLTSEDPEPQGLIPYQSICIQYDSSILPDYDSIICHYSVYVHCSDWTENRHDMIKVKPIGMLSDGSWWDWIMIEGWSNKDCKWSTLCEKDIFGISEDNLCYPLLKSLFDSISYSIESNFFYIKDEDWQQNTDFYIQLSGKDYTIDGSIRLR